VNSDLIVMTFDDGRMAQTVYCSLQAMRKCQVLGLDHSVIMTRDGVGQVELEQGTPSGRGLAGLLADLILRPPGRVEAEVYLDDVFVQSVVSELRNKDSALLFFVDQDSQSDASELLGALALFPGTIHQTTLSPQSESLLRQRGYE
jgi:uncharacterized membrane protein